MRIGGKIMSLKRVFLDAGHGGKDPGACKGSRTEASDVLRLAKAIKTKLLNDYIDVQVGMSRTKDIYESPTKKAQDANDYEADLFISLHRDSAQASANGYTSLVYRNSGIPKKLAEKLNSRMEKIGFRKRGTSIRTGLAVLKHTSMPAILGENGFISNTGDNKLFDEKFDDIVEAYVLSIAEVMNMKKKVANVAKGKVKIAHATTGSESVRGGDAGDQNGDELCTRTWYDRDWNVLIRAKDSKSREKIAVCFEKAVNNDLIGYDQSQRNTLFKVAKEVSYDPSKVKIKCETDCSALATLSCIYADKSLLRYLYVDNNSSTTRNIKERVKTSGKFYVYTDEKYLKDDQYVIRGDLLLCEGKHIVCVLENGQKVMEPGDVVTIKNGATYGGSAYGTKVSDFCIGEKYTIDKMDTHLQNGSNVKEALLKEISSWVPVEYLEKA